MRDQVRQDLGVGFDDAGEHHVKNISQPIRVYTVRLGGAPSPPVRLQALPWTRWVAAVMVLATIAAVAIVYWPRPQIPGVTESLIVMPFRASAGNEAIADSLTKQLTGAVSRISGLAVIAPTIAARIEGPTVELRKVGRDLGVRYALEGRVDSIGDRVRVAAQLVTTESGATIWTGDIDAARPTADGAYLEVIGRLAETVRSEFRAAELKRLGSVESAYVLALRATAELPNAVDVNEVRAARRTFERALQLDPANVLAQIGLADALSFESQRTDVGPERDALLARADAASLRAVSSDPNNAEAWGTRAQVLLFRDQIDAAAQAVERALSLNPYVSDLHAMRAQVLMARGEATEAVTELDRAISLNPRGNAVGVLMNYRCRALLMLGKYDAAIEARERALAFVPDWPDYMLLTAAYAQKDDLVRASAAKSELLRLHPGFSVRWHMAVSGAARARQLEPNVYAGLRKAGVPE